VANSAEILGRYVGESSAFAQLKNSLATEYQIDEKVVSQEHLNKARNWLKHWKSEADSEEHIFDLDEEVPW